MVIVANQRVTQFVNIYNPHHIQVQYFVMTITDSTSSVFKAINLACGGKLCTEPGWINADHNPCATDVVKVNLLKDLPFPDNTFDVVYHAQFIEHLTIENASVFLTECYRILKPNGVLRVVTPDLENQAREYLQNLQQVLLNPDDEKANHRYEWMRLEMMDQLIRNASGGEMVKFLTQPKLALKDYLCERLGRSGEQLLPVFDSDKDTQPIRDFIREIKINVLNIVGAVIPRAYQVGQFRLSGEAHLCMFDQYLLGKMLQECQFSEVKLVNAKKSNISNWNTTLLDSDVQGKPDCPTSLFMEAIK